MGTVTVQALDNEKPCARQKQSTVHNHGPRVYKHARSHMTNTLFPHSPSQWELAYMSLYIIYLYLVKNKLHNSTNLENCFFKLKMTKKTKTFSKLCVFCLDIFCVGLSTKIKEWGKLLRVRNTKPACPPTFRYYFIPPLQQEKQKEGEKTKKQRKKKTIQEMFILLENSSMLHTSERKGGGGINMIQIPNTQHFTFDGVFL